MMKIKFDTAEFNIYGIRCEYDENNIPVDIVICANKNTLEKIQEYCSIGCNMQEVDPFINQWWPCYEFLCWEGLFARLKPFTITGAKVAYSY